MCFKVPKNYAWDETLGSFSRIWTQSTRPASQKNGLQGKNQQLTRPTITAYLISIKAFRESKIFLLQRGHLKTWNILNSNEWVAETTRRCREILDKRNIKSISLVINIIVVLSLVVLVRTVCSIWDFTVGTSVTIWIAPTKTYDAVKWAI